MFAFYGQRKILLTFIVTLYVAEIVAQVVIVTVTVPSIVKIIPNPLPLTLEASHVTVCLPLNIPSLLPNLWYSQNSVKYLDRAYISLDI